MEEIWKDIKCFEGEYQISNFGNLRHFSKGEWRLRKNTNKTGWYFNVILYGKSHKKSCKIHRLVAEAFIPNPENKPQVNHIDCNRQNNHIENLEWVTAKENMQHAIKNKPEFLKPMNNYNKFIRPNKIAQYSLNEEFIEEFANAKEAYYKTGVCARNILQVANKTPFNKNGGIRKQAGGFIWKLV